MKRIAILQHVAFEGPARIADWLALRNLPARTHHLYAGDALPQLHDFDLLILLGGPMNIDEEHLHPWLGAEKRLLREALAAGKRVLGICLGGQLLADALGARVAAMGQAEIGWWPLEKYADSRHSPLGRMLPQRLMALHWHAQAFGLPQEAIALYGSAACRWQGFVWKERAVALQCHLESTPESVEALLAHAGEDLRMAGAVQDAAGIREGCDHCRSPGMPLYRLLDYLSGPHAALR